MIVKVLLLSFGLVLGLTGLIAFLSTDPEYLDRNPFSDENPETTAIQVPETPAEETPLEPEPVKTDALADLAPESFSAPNVLDSGFGASYSGNGSGPGVGGNGLGESSSGLISQNALTDRPPRVKFKTELEYPSEAKRKAIQGYVVVLIEVLPAGQASQIKVLESKPAGVFDQVVLNAIKKWQFDPGVVAGKVAVAQLKQRIRFELD